MLKYIFFSIILFSFGISAAELPNILWLTSEDNGPHLGCYGDKFSKTPHLDALAKKGMIYTRATSNAPVCAPARTTIISGMYPTSTGSGEMRSMANLPEQIKMFPVYLREAGYYCTNNAKEDYNLEKNGVVWDVSSRKANWRNAPDGMPFFSVFNFGTTHESRIRKLPHQLSHDPSKVSLPAYHPDHPDVRRDWAQYYDKISEMDAQVGNKLKDLQKAGLEDDTIVFYFSDHGSGMPRDKRTALFSGLNVPMIVYIPEKWKHLAPKNYMVGGESDRLISFVDLAPTLLSIAGVKAPELMQGKAFMGRYEAQPVEYAYGFRGRMDSRYDMVRTVIGKRYIYVRNYMPHKIPGQYIPYMFETPTTRIWKSLYEAGKLNVAQSYFWKTKRSEELYDLKNDPDEVHNLVDSAKYDKIILRMRKAHLSHIATIRDLGFLPEGERHDRSKGTTPHQMAKDDSKYPFKAVSTAAFIASSMNKKDLSKLVGFIDDSDSAIRYWGVMGLLFQEKTGVSYGKQKLLSALKDSSPYVAITAAEALGKFGTDEEQKAALNLLNRYIDPVKNGVFISMFALNAINIDDMKAKKLLPVISTIPDSLENTHKRFSRYPAELRDIITKRFNQ